MMSEDNTRRRKSIMITLLIQVIVVVVLLYSIAWREPFPPIEEFGIELSFSNLTTAPARPSSNEQNNRSQENVDEKAEEVQPDQPDNQQEVETMGEELQDETEEIVSPIEPLTDTPDDIPAETTAQEPVPESTVSEATSDIEESTEPIMTEETELSEPVEPVIEEIDTTKVQTEITDDQGVSEEGMESEDAVIDDRAIYGHAESEGASLEITGWTWDDEPRPQDDSEETGRIEFEIIIDNEGYIRSVRTLSSTLSPSVEQVYRDAVEKLTFSKTSTYQPALESKGTVTFIIRNKE